MAFKYLGIYLYVNPNPGFSWSGFFFSTNIQMDFHSWLKEHINTEEKKNNAQIKPAVDR